MKGMGTCGGGMRKCVGVWGRYRGYGEVGLYGRCGRVYGSDVQTLRFHASLKNC